MKKLIYIIIFILLPMCSFAQMDRQFIREGNRLYRQKQFDKAEEKYRKAVAANSANPVANYNLGCAMMMLRKDSLAARQFELAGKIEKDKKRRSKAYHNLGVIFQNNQVYDQAIEAYKESLRDNPTDNQTRYNLALCQKMLKKSPQNQNQQNEQKQQQQKKDQEKQQHQQDKQKQQQDKQQQQPQQDQNKMSKENAEQLLNAAMQEERNTKEKMEKMLQQPRSKQLEKNW